MKPLISIIIPVYNVEKYLDKCMQSVLAQTYENFEVILVDDGSIDCSGEICDRYVEKDGRVTAYHKPNGGLSDARNFGVEHANAEIISFVDSDDYITADYLQYLYALMEEYDAPIACAQKRAVVENTDVRSITDSGKKETIRRLPVTEALCDICLNATSACARLYRKELLFLHPFPKGKIYEDLATMYKLVAECDYIVSSSKCIYYYVYRNGSTRHNLLSPEHFSILDTSDELLRFVKNYYPGAVAAAEVQCAASALELVSATTLLRDRESKRYFGKVRKYMMPHLKMVLESKQPLHFKLGCLAIALGYYPTRVAIPIREKLKSTVMRLP